MIPMMHFQWPTGWQVGSPIVGTCSQNQLQWSDSGTLSKRRFQRDVFKEKREGEHFSYLKSKQWHINVGNYLLFKLGPRKVLK